MADYDIPLLPGYPAEYANLLAMLNDGTRAWRNELDTVHEDLIVWQPYPGGYSIGGILLHIAEVETFWIEKFCLNREIDPAELKLYLKDETDVHNGKWPTPPKKPLAYYYQLQNKVRQRTLESVKSFGPPERWMSWGSERMTLRWILFHVCKHEAYHGGQAVMLQQMYSASFPSSVSQV
ncbi:MAG TPA: DinB family protein [Fimbriimonadaceae bacterium]|jgi:uncharacterized damage-inducible protein DinB